MEDESFFQRLGLGTVPATPAAEFEMLRRQRMTMGRLTTFATFCVAGIGLGTVATKLFFPSPCAKK